MAIINGTAEDDFLNGTAEDDTIYGGDGDDIISGSAGNDTFYGEAGDDVISDYLAGSDKLYGGAGNDILAINHYSGAALMDGGVGDDVFNYWQIDDAAVSVRINGGDGNDTITAHSRKLTNIFAGAGVDVINVRSSGGRFNIETGAGSDIININQITNNVVSITDFTVGNNGDKLYLVDFLMGNVYDWNVAANPFALGYFRLVQSGANAVLQFDRDGTGDSYNFSNIVIFQNVSVSSLTAVNLGGFAANGSIPTTTTTIQGTAYDDGLVGTQRANIIRGGDGNDRILGNVGSDRLFGENGNDELYGGLGNDTLYGGNGDDLLIDDGDTGNDQLYGQAGNDTITVNRHGYQVSNDTIIIDGGIGNDTLQYYSPYNDVHNVTINGGVGNDVIESRGGQTVTINAGAGDDLIDLDLEKTNYIVTLGDGRDVIDTGPVTNHDIENIGSITIRDFVPGYFGDVIDISTMTVFIDTLPYDVNPFASGHLRLIQSGADTLFQIDLDPGDTSNGYVTVMTLQNLRATWLTGKNFQANLYDDYYDLFPSAVRGTNGANTLFGTGAADFIFGYNGNDSLDGRGGADTLYGGLGNDRYFIDNADDIVVEKRNEGTDTVITSVSYELEYHASIERIYAWDTSRTINISLTGNQYDQLIIANAGNNIIDGGDGADTMQGLGGNDYYYVDDKGDVVVEAVNGGTDRVYSSISRILEANVEELYLTNYGDIDGYGSDGDYTNIIVGNRSDNYIYGRGGADFLYGDRGDDTIRGGTGRDVLYGDDSKGRYTGADVFEFHAPDFGGANAATADRIVDFDATDRIDLSRVDAVTGGADNAFAFIGASAFTGVAGQLRYQYVSGSTAVQGDMNGDKIADFWIMLDGTHALTTGQFIL